MEVIQLVVRATARSASGVPMLLKAWSPSGHTSRSARLPASCQVVVDAVKAILAT